MPSPRRRCRFTLTHALAAVTALTAMAPAVARANSITVTLPTVTAFSTTGGSVAVDTPTLQSFDPVQGTLSATLTRVHVDIQGSVVANALFTSDDVLQIQQTFTGLGGRFFSFGAPATLLLQPVSVLHDPSSGAPLPTPAVFPILYTYSFDFTPASQLLGDIALNASDNVLLSPGVIRGSLASFTKDPLDPIDQLLVTTSATTSATTTAGGIVTLAGTGTITTTYTFDLDLDQNPPPASAPLPATAFAALALLPLVPLTRRRTR